MCTEIQYYAKKRKETEFKNLNLRVSQFVAYEISPLGHKKSFCTIRKIKIYFQFYTIVR
jgi:hypothetical protein